MTKTNPLTDSQKLDYLMAKVEQIDRAVNPPLWKVLITWFVNHFWTLLLLGILGYFTWQVWEVVQAVQAQVDAVQTQVTGVKLGVQEQFKSLGEALSSVKAFDVSRLKFWE